MLDRTVLDIRNRKPLFLLKGDKNCHLLLSDDSGFLPKDRGSFGKSGRNQTHEFSS